MYSRSIMASSAEAAQAAEHLRFFSDTTSALSEDDTAETPPPYYAAPLAKVVSPIRRSAAAATSTASAAGLTSPIRRHSSLATMSPSPSMQPSSLLAQSGALGQSPQNPRLHKRHSMLKIDPVQTSPNRSTSNPNPAMISSPTATSVSDEKLEAMQSVMAKIATTQQQLAQMMDDLKEVARTVRHPVPLSLSSTPSSSTALSSPTRRASVNSMASGTGGAPFMDPDDEVTQSPNPATRRQHGVFPLLSMPHQPSQPIGEATDEESFNKVSRMLESLISEAQSAINTPAPLARLADSDCEEEVEIFHDPPPTAEGAPPPVKRGSFVPLPVGIVPPVATVAPTQPVAQPASGNKLRRRLSAARGRVFPVEMLPAVRIDHESEVVVATVLSWEAPYVKWDATQGSDLRSADSSPSPSPSPPELETMAEGPPSPECEEGVLTPSLALVSKPERKKELNPGLVLINFQMALLFVVATSAWTFARGVVGAIAGSGAPSTSSSQAETPSSSPSKREGSKKDRGGK